MTRTMRTTRKMRTRKVKMMMNMRMAAKTMRKTGKMMIETRTRMRMTMRTRERMMRRMKR